MKKWHLVGALAILVVASLTYVNVQASDHDDGEITRKGRALNLTDLYVFREGWMTGNTADNNRMVFVMNTNPRSLPKQQYYFATNTRYDFHIDRNGLSKAAAAGTSDDIILRFEFGAQDANNQQPITFTTIRDGVTNVYSTAEGGAAILTTKLGATAVTNSIAIDTIPIKIFAGMRQDTFFFDVTAFFKGRAASAAAGGAAGPFVAAYPATPPVDFTKDYNVNSIVASVPIAWLQNGNSDTIFDVWETISVLKQ